MKSMNNVRKVLFVLFTLLSTSFILNGCGYKPSTYYAKKELGQKVFVKLFVDLKDPRNAVIIKDSLNQVLLQKLNANLVYDEALADTIMKIKIGSVNMQELQYDKEGYNKLYRALVTLNIQYNKVNEQVKNISLEGEHNFSIDDGTTITDTKRFEAIKSAANDALDEFLSKLAVHSFDK